MKQNNTAKSSDPFYYKYRNIFVGFFILIPLLIIPALLIFFLVKSEILEKRIDIYIQCETGSGLMKSTPVNILGTRVGNVHSVTLNRNGYVDVIIRVKQRYSHFIHTDSKAQLRQKNFVVGDWEIDLTMGSDSTTIRDGDTLAVEYQIRLEKIAQLFTDMMEPLESILGSLERGEGIIKYLFGKDTVMSDIHGLLDRVDGLFTRVDRTLTYANSMIDGLSSLGSRGADAIDSLMNLSSSVDQLLKDLNYVVFDLDSLVAGFKTLPADVDTIISMLHVDLKEAEVLLKGVQNHWLLRRAIRKQRELEEKELNRE